MNTTARRRGLTLLVLGSLTVAAAVAYWTLPTAHMARGSTVETPVDVLLVLGSPAEIDGSLTDSQRWRVDEVLREFQAGRASHVLFTGGAAGNRFVEADVMSRYAEQQGLPAEVISREGRSLTTLQNLRNSQALMQARGWQSMEVISSADHLPRTAAILLRLDPGGSLQWRLHAAPTPGRNRLEEANAYTEGFVGAVAFRWFGTGSEPVLHMLALIQHKIAFGVRWAFYALRGYAERVFARRHIVS